MFRRSTAAAGFAATLALTGLCTVGAAGQAEAKPKPGPAAVTGTARIFYTYAADDDIRFTVDAHAVPWTNPLGAPYVAMPNDARGTVRISHHVKATGETATAEGTVDCLATGGGTATVTAVITSASPQVKEWIGSRVGISVQDNHGHGPDRLGFSWDAVGFGTDGAGKLIKPPVGTCMAPAPFAPVLEGGFEVHSAELTPRPGQ